MKKVASPLVIKYTNFVEPRHNFSTILLSGSIILSKSTIFQYELYEKWLSVTFKAHNISAFRTSSLHNELAFETPLEFYLFQLQ